MTQPHPASTVLLLREKTDDGFEVYLCRRHRKASFMGGAYVFPGGRLDEEDCAPELRDVARGVEGARRTFPELPEEKAVGLHFAAVRELFEEAGVLLAVDETGKTVHLEKPAAGDRFVDYREAMQEGELSLLELAREEGLRYDLDCLLYTAHWITPEVEPKRYSARFFLTTMPRGQTPVEDAKEVFEGRWFTPQQALDEARAGDIWLAPPTLWLLHDLVPIQSVEEALETARLRTEVQTVLPTVRGSKESELHFIHPDDPAYETPIEIPESDWRRVVLKDGLFRVHRG